MKLSLPSNNGSISIFTGVFFIIQFMIITTGFAQTNTWDGSSSNNWNTGNNWSLNIVPTAVHDVVININANIIVNTNATINKLTIGNSAAVSLTSSGSSRTITIDNSGSTIGNATVLTLNGSSSNRNLTLAFSGNNQTMNIAGKLIVTDVATGVATFNASNSVTTVNGTLRNQSGSGGTPGSIVPGNNLIFANGGTYEHALNAGSIPTATWDPNSNLVITGTTTTYPLAMDRQFGNVSFDLNLANNLEMTTDLRCSGNVSIKTIGEGSLNLTASGSSRVMIIGGDFELLGGNFYQSRGAATGMVSVAGNFVKSGNGNYVITGSTASSSLTVQGNVTINAGDFRMSESAGSGTLLVAGNFSHTGGTITETSTGSGAIAFNGAGSEQLYTSGGVVSNNINFTVNAGAYLQMAAQNTVVTGNTFTLSANATLGIRSSMGVTTSGASGNVQTAVRTYTASSNFIYNGIVDQLTGDALTITTKANLQIDNPGKVTSNTTAFGISGHLLVSKGNLVLLAADKDYTIAGNLTVAANGTLTHNVNWEANYTKITTAGNVAIDGSYAIGTASRAHVNMTGAGKTVRTGNSSLNILTLNNPAGSIISADGKLTVDDNFWPSWVSAGTFNTNGQNIIAKAGIFIAGGIMNITAASNIIVASLLRVGNDNSNGTLLYNSGALQVNGDISILVNGSLVNTAANTLSLTGHFTNSGAFTPGLGTVKFNGTTAQIISLTKPTLFTNILISNTTVSVNVASDTLKVAGELGFGSVNNATFNTADRLTLVSTAAATANVTDITNNGANAGNKIIGKVNVERFISFGGKWRLLAIPTNSTQTFKQSWQENASTAGANPVAGYGAIIGDNRSNWASNGFDIFTPGGPTVKMYDPATSNYVSISSTNNNIKTDGGYMVYMRGNRSNTISNTTVRTTGELYTGTQPNINIAANQFKVIGNPYASRINVNNIISNGLQEVFYLWDPKAGGSYGLGAYQTMIKMGNDYIIFPGGGSYDAQLSVMNTIESGQAFLVKASAQGGSIRFQESAKQTGSKLVSRNPSMNSPMLRATLYTGTSLLDAAMINFDESFSNAVDAYDITKVANTSENVSLNINNILLVADRRKAPTVTDTVRLNLTGVRVQSYKWVINADLLEATGRVAYLRDAYTNALTPLNLNGETEYSFTIINAPASYAANRFTIVYEQAVVLPVTITSLAAVRSVSKNNEVLVNWNVEEEMNIQHYSVEYSEDGSNFSNIATVIPNANNNGSGKYHQLYDKAPSIDHFYRIRANSVGGQVQYSAIVKVAGSKASSLGNISVYPNPVVNKKMNVQFVQQPKGSYQVALFSNSGILLYKNMVMVQGNHLLKTMPLPTTTPAGNYQLIVTDEAGKTHTQSVIVL